jgi:hypothetical protein
LFPLRGQADEKHVHRGHQLHAVGPVMVTVQHGRLRRADVHLADAVEGHRSAHLVGVQLPADVTYRPIGTSRVTVPEVPDQPPPRKNGIG